MFRLPESFFSCMVGNFVAHAFDVFAVQSPFFICVYVYIMRGEQVAHPTTARNDSIFFQRGQQVAHPTSVVFFRLPENKKPQ